MSIDHFSELLVGLEPLPFERGFSVLEETPRPSFALVAPQLPERLLEQVGSVEPFVGREPRLQRLAAIRTQILPSREQRVLLALDEAPIMALQPCVFALSHLVQRLAQVTHDVKLVEQDRRLRRSRVRCIAKRLPPIHHREPDTRGVPLAKRFKELLHTRLGAILSTEPDRPGAHQIAHHDAIGVPLANRDLVDTDHLGRRFAGSIELHLHILLIQRLDRMPVQMKFLGHVLDTRRTAAPAHNKAKALGIKRVVRKKVELLALHFPAIPALDASHRELDKYSGVPARQIACAPRRAVVPTRLHATTAAAHRFFERRVSVTTRAFGSPKTPRTVGSGWKPGKAYASQNRRFRFDE